MASTATIRATNVKESKEKQNREKLLAGPGSEFSLANPEDFELDYYDYNVINAGAAPGSYLGMDPAYLVWIPPLDDGNIIKEMDDEADEPYYEEILPKFPHIDPGSNTETPSEDDVPCLPPPNNNNSVLAGSSISNSSKNYRNTEICKILAANALSSSSNDGIYKTDDPSVIEDCATVLVKNMELIQMQEFAPTNSRNNRIKKKFINSPVRVHSRKSNLTEEKETTVVKSPSDNKIISFGLDDIQFADDEVDDEEIVNISASAATSAAGGSGGGGNGGGVAADVYVADNNKKEFYVKQQTYNNQRGNERVMKI